MLQNRNSALGSAYVKLVTAVTTARRVGPPLRGAQRAPPQTQWSEPQPRSSKGPGPLRRARYPPGCGCIRNRSLLRGEGAAGVRVQPGPLAPPGCGCSWGRYPPGGRGPSSPPVSQRPGRRPLRLSLQPGLTFRLSHGAEPACGTNAPAAIETRRPRELAAPAAPGGTADCGGKRAGCGATSPGHSALLGFWKARLPVGWGAESSWLSASCWGLLDI